jgi:ELWxxDGT repeat protein
MSGFYRKPLIVNKMRSFVIFSLLKVPHMPSYSLWSSSVLRIATKRMVVATVFCSAVSASCFAQFTLLKDIDQMRDAIGSGVDPHQIAEMNGMLLFAGRSEKGYELWKSDGMNTSLLKDIHPGTNSSNPMQLTNSGGTLYFIADDGLHGPSLWKSNGTASGTVWVKSMPDMIDLPNIILTTSSNAPCILIPGLNNVFFAVRKSPWFWDLWTSDGTPDGTILLRNNFYDGELKAEMFGMADNELIFVATTAANGTELWKSNGTVSGTQILKDISPGTGSSYPGNFKKSGSTLFFVASTPEHSAELWRTDATETGTQMVRDIRPGTAYSNPSNLMDLNGTLMFHATDGTNTGLWKSDGTEAGTVFINNTVITNNSFVLGDKIFYAKANGIVFYNYELWFWDESTQSSTYVRTFDETFGMPPTNMLELGGVLYFVVKTATTSSPGTLQIWRSDGTETGTYPITGFPSHSTFNSVPLASLTKAGGSIFFSVAADAESGNELWKTDGVTGHETQLTDAPAATYDGYIFDLAVMNGALYFPAGTHTNGLEPWISDGTTEGTQILIDIVPGGQYSSSSPTNFTVFNNILFFAAANRLWKASGKIVSEITNGISPCNEHAILNDVLYYPKKDPTSGWQLWKSAFPFTSGEMIKSITSGTAPAYDMGKFIMHKNTIFFKADDYPKTVLWKTDGTTATTVKVKEFGINGVVGDIFSSGNNIYFMSYSAVNGYELWLSDGTEAGTVMLKDIAPGIADGMLGGIGDVNGTFFFIANDGVHGAELWKSDGTAEGTMMVRDIFPGGDDASVSSFAPFGDVLYFAADDGVHGKELWTTDGTEAGTQMVSDLNPGKYSSLPDNLVLHEGVVYFTAYDNTTRSLWKTTGKTCGTMRITNNPDLIAGGRYKNIAVLNNAIFVEAWAPATGWELYKYDIANDPVIDEACKSGQTVIFQPIEGKTYGGDAFTLSASASSGLQVQFNTTTPEIISVNESKVTILKAGSATIIAKQAGNQNFKVAQTQQSFVIEKASQSIIFPVVVDKVYGDEPFILDALTSSGLSPAYTSSDPTVGSVSLGVVTIQKPGTLTITASQAGNENYNSAPEVGRTFNIAKAQQSISFSAPSPRKIDAGAFTLDATSSAGLPVSFIALSNVISIHQDKATPLSPGKAMVEASQIGDDFYFAASHVVHSFCIDPLKPNLSTEASSEGYVIISDHTGENQNRWYLDGTLIPDETSSTLFVTIAGLYTAKVSVDDCTSEESDAINVIITGIEDPQASNVVAVYPNPASGTLTVLLSEDDQKGNVEIFDSKGQCVLATTVSSPTTTLDISHLSPAVYFVQFSGRTIVTYRPLIVK